LVLPVTVAGEHDEDLERGAASTTADPITANKHTARSNDRRNPEASMRSAFCLAFPALAEHLKPLNGWGRMAQPRFAPKR